MPVTIRQIGPCFAGEVEGVDLTPARCPRRTSRPSTPAWTGTRCWCSTTRTSTDEQQLAFTRSLGRDRARHRHQPARGRRVPPADDLRRRLQPRQEQPAVRAGRPATAVRASATGSGTPTARSRWCPRSTRCCTRADPVEGRQHRVRRHARRLRRARRGDEGDWSRASICEHSQIYSRAAARLHRLHRRGARALQAGAPACWCARIR